MTDTHQPVATGVVLPSDRQAVDKPLGALLQEMRPQFEMAAPRGYEASMLIRDVLTATRKDDKLLLCEPMSVVGGAMSMAQLGLRVGVLGHGWLIPFYNSRYPAVKDANGKVLRWGAWQAQLILGYQGLKELAYRSGQIGRITARTVHEGDVFDLVYGTDEHLTHRPAVTDPGEPTGYYATVKLRGADDVMFYYMTHGEALAYRDRYAMAKRDGKVIGPWKDHFEPMAHKSCFRQLSKWVPLTADLALGVAVDNSVRVNIDPDADPAGVSEYPALEAAPETARVDLGNAPEVPVEDPPIDPDAADEAFRKGAKGQ